VPAADAVPYLRIVFERPSRFPAAVAAAVLLFGSLSQNIAHAQQIGLVTSPPVHAATTSVRDDANALPLHRPWPAPVGHRQPRSADVPRDKAFAAWEREQSIQNHRLDRSLIICRC
jgi:hypothetical protein